MRKLLQYVSCKEKKYKWEDRKVTSSICRGKRTINPDSSFEDSFQVLVASRVPHTHTKNHQQICFNKNYSTKSIREGEGTMGKIDGKWQDGRLISNCAVVD